MVNGELLRFRAAVRAFALVGSDYGPPLRGGEACQCSTLLSATAAIGGTLDIWVCLCISTHAETHGLFMRLLPKTFVFWMPLSPKTPASRLVLLMRRVVRFPICLGLFPMRCVSGASARLHAVWVRLAVTFGSKSRPIRVPLQIALGSKAQLFPSSVAYWWRIGWRAGVMPHGAAPSASPSKPGKSPLGIEKSTARLPTSDLLDRRSA